MTKPKLVARLPVTALVLVGAFGRCHPPAPQRISLFRSRLQDFQETAAYRCVGTFHSGGGGGGDGVRECGQKYERWAGGLMYVRRVPYE